MTSAALVWRAGVGGELRVELQHDPEWTIDVRAWLKGHGRNCPVELFVRSASDHVVIWDLLSNGFGSEKQGIGLGTLVVNTAIQALKRHYPASAPVSGHLANPPDFDHPYQRPALEEARRAFWKRFGLVVAPIDADGKEYIRSTVGQLVCIEYGKVAGLYPRYVPLDEFSPGS